MRYNEILLESKKSKLKTIVSDITSGKVPNDVMHKLKNFVKDLMNIDTGDDVDNEKSSDADLDDLLGVEDHNTDLEAAALPEIEPEYDDIDADDDIDDEIHNEDDIDDEDAVDEDELNHFEKQALGEATLADKYISNVVKKETPKQEIGADDLNIYELLKRANPQDADIIWSFYNRSMIESVTKQIFDEKDLSSNDAEKFSNMIIRCSGKLEDKVSLIQRIKDSGVIDLKKVITVGKGSLDKLFNYKSEILDQIKHQLLNLKVSPKSTAVNVGAGEGFFLILGKNVSKLGKGDLNVLGREVEVKAQGARLKGFGGKGTYGDGSKYFQIFNKELIKIIGPKGKLYFTQQYGFNPSQPWHFGLANLQALADVLAKSKSNQAAVKKLFDDMLSFVYPKSTPKMRQRVTATIKRNGSFDVQEFRKEWFLMTYEYYDLTSIDAKTGEGFAGIFFINQNTFSYSFVTSAEQISKNWDDYELNPGLYNFGDAQAMVPKISFGKEIRVKRKKKKAATPKKLK